MKTKTGSLLVAALFLCHALCATGQESTKKKDLLARIGIMGASVSAGHGNPGVRFALFLNGVITTPHEIVDESTYKFGMNPPSCAFNAISRLKKEKVTFVIAVDYFYWFCYGFLKYDQRLTLLKKGCALAEELACPLVVGDIPHMGHAKVAKKAPGIMPTPDELNQLNKELHQWAKKHNNVHILPLASWVENLKQGKPIVLNGKEQTFEMGEILHPDGIHPMGTGAAVLAMLTMEGVADKYPSVQKADLLLNLDTLHAALKARVKKKGEQQKAPR